MKYYEFGDESKPVILLLPGTCCHWENNFEGVTQQLVKDFFVVCVSYDGFDETEESEFSDMLTETAKIEEYIIRRFKGNVHAVYGCSLGGSFVGLLAQRQRIHMNHGILGSSDLDQASRWSAKLQATLMVPILYRMIHQGKAPHFLRKSLLKSGGEEYLNKGFKMMGIDGIGLPFVTKRTVRNQYYSDLVTELHENIEIPGTIIHCFYAAKMGEAYLERYHKYFAHPHIVKHDLRHEELLLCRPEEWCENVKKCVL